MKLPAWLFVRVRSGAKIVVLAPDELLPGTGSRTPAGAVTVAVFVTDPRPVAVPLIVKVTDAPAGSVVTVLVTAFPRR